MLEMVLLGRMQCRLFNQISDLTKALWGRVIKLTLSKARDELRLDSTVDGVVDALETCKLDKTPPYISS